MRVERLTTSLVALLATAVALAACSSSSTAGGEAGSSAPGGAAEEITTLRLGYFPNLTHAPALVGMQQGHFKNALKDLGITVTPTVFNAGPDVVTALFADSLDCSYIGPTPR